MKARQVPPIAARFETERRADPGVDCRHREEIEHLVYVGNRAAVILGNGVKQPQRSNWPNFRFEVTG
jgi:hypothetical protein